MKGRQYEIQRRLNAISDSLARWRAAQSEPCDCSFHDGFQECFRCRILQDAYWDSVRTHGAPTLSEYLDGRHPLAPDQPLSGEEGRT